MNTKTIEKKPNVTFSNGVCLEKEKTSQDKPFFNHLITEATDSAFSSLLGEVNKQGLCQSLSSRFGISKKKISSNIEGFSNALDQIFGKSAHFLEACIIRTLNNKTPMIKIFPLQEVSFTRYVESLWILFIPFSFSNILIRPPYGY
jgi:hypothetical protein